MLFLNGEDVSSLIRTPEISMGASKVSSVPVVRAFLLDLQRNIAKNNNVIMDGRDIGSVVLPNADVKIFLLLLPNVERKDDIKSLLKRAKKVTYEDVLADVNQRDYQDSHREIAPMKPCADSVMADTTGNTLEQSIDMIVNIIKGDK